MYEKCQNELKAGNGQDYINGDKEERRGSLKGTPKKVNYYYLSVG